MMEIMDGSGGQRSEQSVAWDGVRALEQGKHQQVLSFVQQPRDPGVQTQDSATLPTTKLHDGNKVVGKYGLRKEVTYLEGADVTRTLCDERERFGMEEVQFSSFNCKKVGNYLLGPSIGEGSYGSMRLATHYISKQMVAVKVVNKKILVQREVARRHFRRETLLLQRVSHPNIVKLYEAMETCNSYYLVFELANGGSVLDILAKKGAFSEDESRPYLRQVTSAIDHLHRSDVVHRDIKLENLLIDSNGDVKLVDFGLSAVCHDSDHQLSTQCGSPVYAAPELFAGRKYGKPVDLWSIGVCLFAMLTGKLPFTPEDGSSLAQLYSLILKGCVVPGDLSLNCQSLLGRLLDLQEGRRISAEELLSHPWVVGPDGQRVDRVPVSSLKVPVVDPTIVTYMTTTFRFSQDDVLASVQQRKLNCTAATYNILKDRVGKGLMKTTIIDGTMSMTTSGTGSDDHVQATAWTREGEISPENREQLLSQNVFKKKESSHSPESYKSHLLLLKHSRNHRRFNEATSLQSEKFKTGRSPLSSSNGGQGAVPFFITPLSGVPLTLPPIQTADPAGVGANLKTAQKDTDGKRNFILPDRREVLRLNVKGEAPNLCDRTKFHLPPTTGSHNTSLVHGSNYRHNPPPPPPPPNSHFGDNSAVSRSTVSHSQDSRKLSNGSEARGPGDSLHESVPREPGDERPEEELRETFVSRLRFFREPRTSLATLRDPFGTDSWRRSRPGKRMSGSSQRGVHPVRSSDSEHIPKAYGDFDSWKEKFRGQGEGRETFSDASAVNNAANLFNTGETTQIVPSASLDSVTMGMFPPGSVVPLDTQDSPRQGSVTPLSLSQEYLSPVTRVTITTTGHH
ncbi:unnamed protein product [Lymnaea stagnalis]|uniref:Protein kinase domain-containing protein n=1 Tax=Lymnaea stagnalis TaxID=6523 RepID=A0AAV2IC59_LYMST